MTTAAAAEAAVARTTSQHGEQGGGRRAALFPQGRRLGIEALVIAALIALGGFLVYHFTVHTIRNKRPLAGPNIDVGPVQFDQSEAAFAVDPSAPNTLFGASNDTGLETLDVYRSEDGGTTWRRADGPAVPGGSCAYGAPAVAAGANGTQYLAFLASQYCGDSLTPYLVVTSRAGAADKWAPLERVAPATWKYGFDDAPDIAVDEPSGVVYLAWTRSLSKTEATVVTSASRDRGRTWSAPAPVSDVLRRPHHASLAVAPNGDVYVAGIDARVGLWVSRSTDGARTFSTPRAAAPLLANPAGGCALTAEEPLANELRTCAGPDPAVSVGRGRIYVVYGDVGANRSPDVFAAALSPELKPLFRAQVNPAETKATQQFIPASAVDQTTGVLWACWYDTTFDPHAHRAWFTCSASHNGRTWTPPERAAATPTPPPIIFGALGKTGLYPAVAARDGVAHAFWGDGRVINNLIDIFTVALRERDAFAAR